jgi:hypothetical protein
MAKPGAKDESAGMDRAEIKRHLRFAREEPIPVAFALGGDGKAVLQFDRRKPGRALERQLKEEAPDSKNHRWGTALVDPDNPKLVRFTVNKAGGGMARRLVVALKGTGFSKVKIVLDDGTELEAHEEEDEDAPEEENGAAAPRQAPEADPSQTDAEPPPATEATSPDPAAQPDAAALTRDLTGLVKRMLGVIAKDPTQKAALAELATDAQASLKRGDLAQASAGIDILRQAIEAAEAGASAGPARPGPEKAPGPATEPALGAARPAPNGAADGVDIRKEAEALLATVTGMVKQLVPFLGAVPGLGDMVKEIAAAVQASIKAGDLDRAHGLADQLREILGGIGAQGASSPPAAAPQPKRAPAHAKARQAWVATRKKVADEVDKLHDTFSSAIDGHGMADQLAKTFRERVDGVLETLDESLAHTLEAVDNATDEAERAKLVQQAHATVQRFQAHVASDPVVAMLDRNPFVPLSIAKTVGTTLSALSKSVR